MNGTNTTSRNPKVVFTERGTYNVRLRIANDFGTNELEKTDYIIVGVSTTESWASDYAFQIGPNPITAGKLHLQYNLPKTTRVRLSLFDAKGNLVQSLFEGIRPSGRQQQALDFNEIKGVYFLQVQLDEQTRVFKILAVQ